MPKYPTCFVRAYLSVCMEHVCMRDGDGERERENIHKTGGGGVGGGKGQEGHTLIERQGEEDAGVESR